MCDTDSMAIVATEKGGLCECEGGTFRLNGKPAIKSLPWRVVDQIASTFEALNPYDKSCVKGSILKVEDVNFDKSGERRELFGYGVSAKRYSLFVRQRSTIDIVKPSEHGLGLYKAPKEGRDAETNCPTWIIEAWHWIVSRALGLKAKPPKWFAAPAMRRIAISTPRVMQVLRKIDRDRARPYNFALSPVLVNLSGSMITLLAPYENEPSKWMTMQYINIHDGQVCTLQPPSINALPQTFDLVLSQYEQHVEAKSLGPDGKPCMPDTAGVVGRYPVTATQFRYVGKETERGWEYAEDPSTLIPSLVRYDDGSAEGQLRSALEKCSLSQLEKQSGLSRHTIINAREGRKVHPRTLKVLRRTISQSEK